MKISHWLGRVLLASVLLLAFIWAFGALYYHWPSPWLAGVQTLAILEVFVFARRWRLLPNGKADEMLFQRGALHTGGLALAADAAPDFSARIRKSLPGM